MPDLQQIRAALRSVHEPELHQNIVDLGLVRSIAPGADGSVHVAVALTAADSPARSQLHEAIVGQVIGLEGVTRVEVSFDTLGPQERQALQQRLGREDLPTGSLAAVKNVICVGSGKGGVGKSTVTANLAAALFAEGKRSGSLDADVWGYSQPRMLGVHGKPYVSASRKILPLTSVSGVKVMSIEFFLGQQEQAVVWRGPMLHKAIRQFLEDVDWGELDYLLIDLPPGTGDVSMTLAQLLPQARFVLVTTPQPAAQKVAARAAETARRFDLEIAGVVENMSGFTTPSGERFTIFGEGGGQLLADELDVPLLAKIPLQEELRTGADEGRPLVVDDPDAPASQAIFHAARGLIALSSQVAPVLQPPANPILPLAGPAAGTGLPMAPPAAARAGAGTSLPMAASGAARPPAGGVGLPMAGGGGTPLPTAGNATTPRNGASLPMASQGGGTALPLASGNGSPGGNGAPTSPPPPRRRPGQDGPDIPPAPITGRAIRMDP